MNARHLIGLAPLIVVAIPVAALAKNCDEVKIEIDAKIKAKGVTNYVLQIVDQSDANEGLIVGNCGQGAKKIVYLKNALPSSVPSPKSPQPLSPTPATPIDTEATR
jgi:hypothetical protein